MVLPARLLAEREGLLAVEEGTEEHSRPRIVADAERDIAAAGRVEGVSNRLVSKERRRKWMLARFSRRQNFSTGTHNKISTERLNSFPFLFLSQSPVRRSLLDQRVHPSILRSVLQLRLRSEGDRAKSVKDEQASIHIRFVSMPLPPSASTFSPSPAAPSPSSSSSPLVGMRPPAAWVDRIASSLAFYPPFPSSYTIKRQPDGNRELYVAPTRESRLPSCAFAEAALLLRDGGRKQVAAALIPAPTAISSSSPASASPGSKARRRVILFAHGNAVDLAQQLPFLRALSVALAKSGDPVAIACFDYQGYGESRRVSVSEDEDGKNKNGGNGRAARKSSGGAPSPSPSSCACISTSSPDAASLPRQKVCPDHGAAPESSTADALLDGAAALQWLLEGKGFEPSEVVLYGQSLGSGVATSLAVAMCERERKRAREEDKQKKKNKGAATATATATATASPSSSEEERGLAAAGLVLHSPLASGLRVLKPSWRWWPSVLDIFPVAKAAAKLSCSSSGGGKGAASKNTKCLIIHGDADDVVPFGNGKEVFDSLPLEARVEPLWVAGGGHCDLEGKAGFLPRLLKFLKEEIG